MESPLSSCSSVTTRGHKNRITLDPEPALSTIRPFCTQWATMADTRVPFGILLSLSFTNSIPIMHPIPLTSPTSSNSIFQLSNSFRHFSAILRALAHKSSFSMISMVLRAEAQARALPPKVPPMTPPLTPSKTSLAAVTALKGRPPAMDFAETRISGGQPASFQ